MRELKPIALSCRMRFHIALLVRAKDVTMWVLGFLIIEICRINGTAWKHLRISVLNYGYHSDKSWKMWFFSRFIFNNAHRETLWTLNLFYCGFKIPPWLAITFQIIVLLTNHSLNHLVLGRMTLIENMIWFFSSF